jgi:sugar transferase (PEP-CTERM/EpsH1 system associated)
MKAVNTGRVNILYVILSFEIGGMEQMVADLILSLDRTRFNPVVVCLKARGPIAAELEQRGITIITLDPMTPLVSFVYPGQLVRIMRDHRIDVVHTHSGAWHKAAIAGFWGGVRSVVYTDHGRFYPDSRKLIILDRLYSPFTSHVVCVSDALAEYMVHVVGISPGKVRCIINGIEENKFSSARASQKNHADRIGIIARLAPVKDIATLIRAVKVLHERGIESSLTIAGDGPERDSLEQLSASLGIADAVSFLGFRRDIVTVLAEIDLFVLCSLSEGTSLTLLEAMAAGKPVVATNVGGNPAIVKDGVNGLLVLPGDQAALADALQKLMVDRELRESMSAANIRTIRERYSLKEMTASYEALYAG